jgi:hypothetical protein
MAWFWLSIIVLLIPAYYGVYVYVSGLRNGRKMTPWKRAVGWASAVCFVVIGFMFANGFSLMTNVAGWPALWLGSQDGGAALGTALNLGDPTLWPRWLLMIGLAVMTTAVWPLVDATWLSRDADEAQRRWAAGFAPKLFTAGMVWFALVGAWYAFGTWNDATRTTMAGGWLHGLTIVTALSPGLPWVLLMMGRNRLPGRSAAALVAAAQFGVLALNAISRQIVQNVELAPYLEVSAQKESVQWSPLVAFLLIFVAGVVVVAWMIAQAVKAPSETQPTP